MLKINWKSVFLLSVLLVPELVWSNLMNNPDESINIGTHQIIPNTCDTNQNKYPSPPPMPPRYKGNTSVVTIWFDDAWKSQFTTAFPLMEAYHYKGAISVAVDLICKQYFLSWDELRFLQSKGWEITSHSMSHSCNFGYYTTKTTEYEIKESKKVLLEKGLRANQFVMPCGYDKNKIEQHFIDKPPPIIEMADRCYSAYRTTKANLMNTLPLSPPYYLGAFQIRNVTTEKSIQQALDEAKKKNIWLIFVFHQIDETNNTFSMSRTRFEGVLKLIKASQLPVVLPSQVIPEQPGKC